MRHYHDTVPFRDLRVCVKYTYIRAVAEEGPSYASGGQPAEPAESEIIEASIVDDDDEVMGLLFDKWWPDLLDATYDDLCASVADTRAEQIAEARR